jgi:alkylation response protein AidB-like acyl-CoA dehydrogenase
VDLRLSDAEASPAEQEAVAAVLREHARVTGDEVREHAHFADSGHAARGRRHLLLPALHAVMDEVGWITAGALNHIARMLSVPPADVYGVATFYAMLSVEPRAPHVVHVCDEIACGPRGGEEIAARLADELDGNAENRFQGMPSDGDSRAAYEAMGRDGWIGLHWPERLGGGGRSLLDTAAVEERFGYRWLPLSAYLLSVKTIGSAMLHAASPELQERLLLRIASGELVFCQGCSEPEAGSDLAGLRTTARAERDGFIVSGHKLWTSSAQIADWIYLAVRTDPHAKPHRGISVLVADMRSPGIEVRTIETLGGGLLGEIFLEDVEVPADQLVGELHGGWRVLMATLDHERVTSEKVGVVARVLDDLEPALGTAHRRALRRLRGEAEAARLHGRRACELLQARRPAAAQASMAKLSIATLAQRVVELGVEALGPEALIERGPGAFAQGRLAAVARASVGSTIAGGAAEIQRRVIARMGLGCAA